MLPTLRFSREFRFVFWWICLADCLKTCGLLDFGLVSIKFACFLQIFVLRIAFFFKVHGTFGVQLTAKRNLGMFLCKFAHFGLVFSIFPPIFLFNLPAVLCFF